MVSGVTGPQLKLQRRQLQLQAIVGVSGGVEARAKERERGGQSGRVRSRLLDSLPNHAIQTHHQLAPVPALVNEL